jgi:hypothetical protein
VAVVVVGAAAVAGQSVSLCLQRVVVAAVVVVLGRVVGAEYNHWHPGHDMT